MTATRRFGYLGGGLLTAIGALGLAITGLADPLAATGRHLLVMEVTPAQNLVHLLLGLTLVLGGAGSPAVARTTALVGSAVLGTLGLVGLTLTGALGDPLALDGWANGLHVGLAVWGGLATLRHHQRAAATCTTAARHR